MQARSFSIPLLVIAFALFVAGCKGTVTAPPSKQDDTPSSKDHTSPNDKPKVDPTNGSTNTDIPRDPAKVKPEVLLTATELVAEFNKDAVATRAKYKDKILEISGSVETGLFAFGWHDSAKAGYVMFELEGPRPVSIQCEMAEPEPWATLAPGQPIKVKGLFQVTDGPGMLLKKCVLVEAGSYPGVPLSSEQLVRDFQSDKKLHDGKYLVVSGEIVGKKPTDDGGYEISLKGNDKTAIHCRLDRRNKQLGEQLSVGEKLKMSGFYHQFEQDLPEGVKLLSCLPITHSAK